MGMITNRDENKWHINSKVWYDLMEDALKYPTKTYAELKIPYSFELDRITDEQVENIKEIIYDLRNEPTFGHFLAGMHLGMIAITGSLGSEAIEVSALLLDADGERIPLKPKINVGDLLFSVKTENPENMTYTITFNTDTELLYTTSNELDWNNTY